MATDLDASFNELYLNINTKLKKRFMRKPNISEATNEFNSLAIQCEHAEQPTFAGHAYIGAAKCENSAGNFLGEAEYYVTAARQFMKAENKLCCLKCYSPARENLEAAIGCYIQALTKYPEQSPLRTSTLLALAHHLATLDHKLEAIAYYQQAMESIENIDSTLKLTCLMALFDLYTKADLYDEALNTANIICDSLKDVPEKIITDIQVSRVILTLIVEPLAEKTPPSLNKLMQDLLDDKHEELPFNTDLYLKLQSIMISCSGKDLESLVEVSAESDRIFSLQHQHLLLHLISQYEKAV